MFVGNCHTCRKQNDDCDGNCRENHKPLPGHTIITVVNGTSDKALEINITINNQPLITDNRTIFQRIFGSVFASKKSTTTH